MEFNFNLNERPTYSYPEFRALVEHMCEINSTTGPEKTESRINYTQLNKTRILRWDKRYTMDHDLEYLLDGVPKQTWLVLAESWCGDAAQNLPMINKFAERNPQIDLKILLRDDNLDIMEKFLDSDNTFGIPKLIALNERNEVLFEWGSRPSEIRSMFNRLKKEMPIADAKVELHKYYAKNKGKALENDFKEILREKFFAIKKAG